jgi:hypothetical protein
MGSAVSEWSFESARRQRGYDYSDNACLRDGERRETHMATGETGFDDVTFDLISVQYHSLKAGHDYGQYVRDAKNAGQNEIASFFEQVMAEDSERARKCHEFLAGFGGTDNTSPQNG